MLQELFDFVEANRNHLWVHWNMRDINYGFAALEHRASALRGDKLKFAIPDHAKFDLSRIFAGIYGVSYIGHPRLRKLVEKNNITDRDFLDGKEEARAFEHEQFVELHRSTLRKVDILCSLADRAYTGELETNASWWQKHGSHARGMVEYLRDHPVYFVIVFAFAVFAVLRGVGLM